MVMKYRVLALEKPGIIYIIYQQVRLAIPNAIMLKINTNTIIILRGRSYNTKAINIKPVN